ncbi:thiosulfate oxidation carrier protein SoxY [Elioraea sp.]|uniref:thiosulfate oxidation carrier protein SoxY n=1 Tax=Elioraea sp. TaxID=2185103 RepID=UPI0025BECEF3|nr:thiosulfate oxidation carrier protein SoxY [Elioraea sp.]
MTTRRTFIGFIALLPLPWQAVAADDDVAAAIREATGGREPVDGGITLTLPARAENGGQVPVTVAVESPQTEALFVTAIHLVATRNPTPGIASFALTPAVARAEVTTRIRLAEDQQVIAIAELSDGTLRRAVAAARVTVGGCIS